MKKLLLAATIGLWGFCSFSGAAKTYSVTGTFGTATALTSPSELKDGAIYYIYDAHKDNETAIEQDASQTCRYAVRKDDNGNVRGTHIKPVNATNLDNTYAWIAEAGENGSWAFKNLGTGKYIYNLQTMNAAYTTTADINSKGYFYIVSKTFADYNNHSAFSVSSGGTERTNLHWDGQVEDNKMVSWGNANNPTDGHPYLFYELTEDNGTLISTNEVIVNYKKGNNILYSSHYSVIGGNTLTLPIYPAEILTYDAEDSFVVNNDMNITANFSGNVNPFKLACTRYPNRWAVTNANGLTTREVTSADAEWLIEVPGANNTFKIFSTSALKYLAAIVDNADETAYTTEANANSFVFERKPNGAELIWNSSKNVAFNIRSNNVAGWSGTDHGSWWFMVYDETTFNNNRTSFYGESIGNINSSTYESTFQSNIAAAQTKYEAAKDVEAFAAQAANLKSIIDRGETLRFGKDDIVAYLTELNAANNAIDLSELAINILTIIRHGNEFAAMGIAPASAVNTWETATENLTYTEQTKTDVIAAFKTLVESSANTPGGANIKLACYKVATDYLNCRIDNNAFIVKRNGSDVNGNKTTWTLKAAEGGFYLYNNYANKYVKAPVRAENQNSPEGPTECTAVESTEDATVFMLDLQVAEGTPRYGLKIVGATSYPYLHTNTSIKVVRWNITNDSGLINESTWYLYTSTAETAANEAAIGATDNVNAARSGSYVSAEHVGTCLGQIYSAAYSSAVSAFDALTDESTPAQKHAAADGLRNAYSSASLNMPRKGGLYRFKNVGSQKYLSGQVAQNITNSANLTKDRLILTDANNEPNTIWYIDENSVMVNFYNGLVITKCIGTIDNWGATLKTNTDEASEGVNFIAQGTNYIIEPSSGRHLYGNRVIDGVTYTECSGNTATDESHQWIIEPVEYVVIPTYSVNGKTLASVNCPVPLYLGYGDEVRATAYTAALHADRIAKTEVIGANLPANTPALLEVDITTNNFLYATASAMKNVNYSVADPIEDAVYSNDYYAFAPADGEAYYTLGTDGFTEAEENVNGFNLYFEAAEGCNPVKVDWPIHETAMNLNAANMQFSHAHGNGKLTFATVHENPITLAVKQSQNAPMRRIVGEAETGYSFYRNDVTLSEEGVASIDMSEVEPGNYTLTVPAEFFMVNGTHYTPTLVADIAKNSDGTTVGINEVMMGISEGTIFDLQGRRLAAPAKGINIIGGRKVLVK